MDAVASAPIGRANDQAKEGDNDNTSTHARAVREQLMAATAAAHDGTH
jgi:hypothetical protein